nr:hypothetical protein [Amycolatopsis sacchari]
MTAPGTSMRARSRASGVASSEARVATSRHAPMGTLTSSTQRQLSAAVRTPPSTMPAAPALAAATPHQVRARVRAPGSVWLAVIRLRLDGPSAAAPAPCTRRATSSIAPSEARPPSRLAAVNTTSPATKTRRRPSRSPARDASSSRPPKVIR